MTVWENHPNLKANFLASPPLVVAFAARILAKSPPRDAVAGSAGARIDVGPRARVGVRVGPGARVRIGARAKVHVHIDVGVDVAVPVSTAAGTAVSTAVAGRRQRRQCGDLQWHHRRQQPREL